MYDRIRGLISDLTGGLYERDGAVRLGLLAALSGESLFLLGPPGVGKSLIARRLEMVFSDARIFTYLMGRFSTPDEVFGPLSIRALKQDDRYERVTENYLPTADVVFLDEIWKASAPIRNALLTALNERVFRNGTSEVDLPLKVFIGASNELPEEDETAEAFWDRFLIRVVLEPVSDPAAFRQLVTDTDDIYRDVVPQTHKISDDEFTSIRSSKNGVTIPATIAELLTQVRAHLASAGHPSSDRRWKQITGLLRASAFLHDRTEVDLVDCVLIRHCAWHTGESRSAVIEVVDGVLAQFATSSVDSEAFGVALKNLEKQIDQTTIEVLEEEQTEPVIYRDEYYRIEGLGIRNNADSVLIWRGDVDEAPPDSPTTADVFAYDAEGTLLGSDELEIQRSEPWTLHIDGVDYAIESTTGTAAVTRSREPSADERAQIQADGTALAAEIQRQIDRLTAMVDEIESDGTRHLFVDRREAQPILLEMTAAAEHLVELRLEVEQLMKRLD